MPLVTEFVSKENRLPRIELSYGVLFKYFNNNEGNWFCRIWRADWLESTLYPFGESYGKTKFEAYRKAAHNLKNNIK